jgi:heme-degrading monooxygenase HmoA
MHARMARYQVDPQRCDEAVASFREAGAKIGALEGFESGYLLIDSDSGEVITLTFWDSHASLDASEMRATSARQGAVHDVDGEVAAVTRYDVVRELGA